MSIKFNLGWILAITAALLLAALGFLSFFYGGGGELLWPIVVAVALFVLPLLVCMFMVPAKECSRPFYFHKEAVKEGLLLLAMIVLFLGSMPLINHFYTVNSRADRISEAVSNQRKQLDEMQESYGKHVQNRVKYYRAYLNEVAANKRNDPGTYAKVFPNGSDDIDLMVQAMNNSISLVGLKDSVGVKYGSDKIRWWQLPSIMNNVENISGALDKNYQLMLERDRNFTDDKGANWEYEYSKADDIMPLFTKRSGLISSLWAVLSSIIAFIIILLPYMAADRDSRSGGLFAELFKHDDEEEDLFKDRSIGRI